MPGKIRKAFSSLARSLRLQPAQMDLELQDDVVPVVLIHEHCEGDSVAASATMAGPNAGGTLIAAQAPEEGAYQVILTVQWLIAIAAAEPVQFRIRDRTTSADGTLLWFTYIGQTGALTGERQMLIPKLHIPGNSNIEFDVLTAILVGDEVTASVLLQPI